MDSITDICIVKSFQKATKANYQLPFELSKQQQYASEAIIQAIKNNNDLLLYAVTGAGKTEMMFEGIRIARQMGHNIAIVSPRVDVIIEISHRIKDAFIDERIDVLHQSSRQQYNGHFVIATIHHGSTIIKCNTTCFKIESFTYFHDGHTTASFFKTIPPRKNN